MHIDSRLFVGSLHQAVGWIALYVGPDLILPLTSALAAVAGVLLMFWHKFVGLLRAVWRFVFRHKDEPRG